LSRVREEGLQRKDAEKDSAQRRREKKENDLIFCLSSLCVLYIKSFRAAPFLR